MAPFSGSPVGPSGAQTGAADSLPLEPEIHACIAADGGPGFQAGPDGVCYAFDSDDPQSILGSHRAASLDLNRSSFNSTSRTDEPGQHRLNESAREALARQWRAEDDLFPDRPDWSDKAQLAARFDIAREEVI